MTKGWYKKENGNFTTNFHLNMVCKYKIKLLCKALNSEFLAGAVRAGYRLPLFDLMLSKGIKQDEVLILIHPVYYSNFYQPLILCPETYL